MLYLQLVSFPVVGALIGWITNILAIKLIFRPYQPVRIPLINYTIQGLIPKRRYELAVNVGQIVAEELLTMDDLLLRVEENNIKNKISQSVIDVVVMRLHERIPGLVPGALKKVTINLIVDILHREVPVMVDKFIKEMADHLKEEIDLARMIEEKINGFDLHELERMIFLIASRELRHIVVLGAVLGFVIGLVQDIFYYFMNI